MKRVVFYTILSLFFIGCASKKDVCKRPDMLDLSNETMSFIRGGEFLMGAYDDPFKDRPPKEVHVSSFYIDKTEVTNKMYKEYIEAQADCKPKKPPFLEDPKYGADELPVVGVTYKEALKFCKFYNKRLPTEAEWEYAARGGFDMKKFPWGDIESSDFMNYRGSKNSMATPVKSYPPNNYDLYDMAGNVWEWVYDCYRKDPELLPDVDPVNAETGFDRVYRGGGWYSYSQTCRVAYRFSKDPSYRNDFLGVRFSRSLSGN